MQLASIIHDIVKKLPKETRFTFIDKIIRSSISIPSNIAEGSGRKSQKDFKRYLQISLGSCYELETQLLLMKQNGIYESESSKRALEINNEIQKMLYTIIMK